MENLYELIMYFMYFINEIRFIKNVLCHNWLNLLYYNKWVNCQCDRLSGVLHN